MSNLDTAKPPPHFKKEGDYHRLIVDGKPFLIIGGEIAPSTSSSAASMARKWQDIKTLGLNTVLLAVTWEVFEPKEGEFNTDLVASLVAQAREAGIRVILHVSWYGSMKGGCAQCGFYHLPYIRFHVDPRYCLMRALLSRSCLPRRFHFLLNLPHAYISSLFKYNLHLKPLQDKNWLTYVAGRYVKLCATVD